MERVLKVLGLIIFAFLKIPLLEAQQVTCTPAVLPAICKQFDASFGATSMWPVVNFTRGVEITIVAPTQFKAERAKLDAEKEAAANNAKTVGDVNRTGGREAGGGVFDYELLECPGSSAIKRIVISTEAASDPQNSSISSLSEQLLFYTIGYDQGLLRGSADALP